MTQLNITPDSDIVKDLFLSQTPGALIPLNRIDPVSIEAQAAEI